MKRKNLLSVWNQGLGWRMAAVAAATLITGCVVAPLHPHTPAPSVVHVPVPAPAPLTLSVRLYPANDAASAYGVVSAVVTNDLNGRGKFSTNINGENFFGEATRAAQGGREGHANGAGNRGSYINCRYQMNSSSLGSGQCHLSGGAVFNMHVGS
jgi:hypothetical protein